MTATEAGIVLLSIAPVYVLGIGLLAVRILDARARVEDHA